VVAVVDRTLPHGRAEVRPADAPADAATATDQQVLAPAAVARIRRRMAEQTTPTASPSSVRAAVAEALHAEGVHLPPGAQALLVRDLADHVAGLGPIQALLRQPGVTDVMVNGPRQVWVERHGRLEQTDVAFADADAVLDAVRRVVGPLGGRIDRSRPFVDATLPDGSRLHAVAAPIVADGPLVTVRRFDARLLDWSQLIATGTVPEPAADLLRAAVADRRAVVVCGRTGSGKTTLLQRLLSDVADADRVVLIEDAPELRPQTAHLVRMQTRPASAEGTGAVEIATLVRQALRMRPDRIVVGEVRGVEVADVLQALITGHEGCMTTVHASSAAEALVRLEGMALQAGLPLAAAQAQIGSALDVVVSLDRGTDGTRGVVEIADISLDGRAPVATPRWRRDLP
jgi:pilus assembly protein CpaF